MVEHGAAGALLYTYDHGHVTELQSGLADIAAERPMGPQDRYRIGSLTKTYVSTAVLQLVAEHRVDLAAPVSRYLPGLMGGAPRLTIRQLLNHTSGLYEFNDDPRVLAPYLAGRPRARVVAASARPSRPDPRPGLPPGSEYHYSNTNYLLAGLVVQAVTGHRLADVLAHRVFAPARADGDDLHAVADVARPCGTRVLRLPGRRPADATSRPSTRTPGPPAPWCRPRRTWPASTGACSRAAAAPTTHVGDADDGGRLRRGGPGHEVRAGPRELRDAVRHGVGSRRQLPRLHHLRLLLGRRAVVRASCS